MSGFPDKPYHGFMVRSLRWSLLCIPLILSACAENGACTIASVGDMPVLNGHGSPIVKASINGHPVAFIVDTGSLITAVWPQEIDKLGLYSTFRQVRLRGVGGETLGTIVTARSMGLGAATASDVSFVAVGKLMDGRAINGIPVVGLLGADFLSSYDVVFDLPNHQVNLYDVHGCKGVIPRWTGGFYSVPTDEDHRDPTKIIVRVKLDGHPMDAILDSGAQRTLIAASDAHDAGVTQSTLAGDRKGISFGIDDQKLTRFLHRFDTFQIGPFHFDHPLLPVSETDESLLGAEFLRNHRVWIPRARNEIFVQPTGPFTPIEPPATAQPDAPSGRNKPE
ncbi:aspartyl protease family protein [Gluconacetobacter sp. Hr-1-5]|uniref:aspartyl protease family protein n=1 Tax=Gluconacetobacter sp. Hr-1-5 TaxID=3395370 RepID=UPI003B517ED1